jgi:hypothetical protein
MIEKQWFGCSVSWSAESWPENGTNQARFSMALNTKTSLLHDIEPIAIPIKTIPNHSWDVSRAFVMIEKQWVGCSVSWSAESRPENGTNHESSQILHWPSSLSLHQCMYH